MGGTKGQKKKLGLSKESLRKLRQDELRRIGGGLGASNATDACSVVETDECNPTIQTQPKVNTQRCAGNSY